MLTLGQVKESPVGETNPSHPLPYLSPECQKQPQPSQDRRSAFLATDTRDNQVCFLDRSPVGKGCLNCPRRLPVLELESGAYCLRCIGLWFPNWTVKQVRVWVAQQKKEAKRITKEKERANNEL